MSEDSELMRAYAVTFGSPAGQIVLADLQFFCKIINPLAGGEIDPATQKQEPEVSDRRLFMNEGRREVVLRIQKFSSMTIESVYDLWLGRRSHLRTTEGEPIDG